MSDKLEIGDSVDWIHGEHYRAATILEFSSSEPTKVLLQGVSGSIYWMKLDTLIKKINAPLSMPTVWRL